MTKLTKPCDQCEGRGIVPRDCPIIGEEGERRPDPLDTRRVELCQKCTGSGVMADTGPYT